MRHIYARQPRGVHFQEAVGTDLHLEHDHDGGSCDSHRDRDNSRAAVDDRHLERDHYDCISDSQQDHDRDNDCDSNCRSCHFECDFGKH
mmetsp:Transcript_19518/g.56789  ORF Transcript_19518/g.56789 Transcript_19518/m.56789 type:complete len:89 (+) Transcript_19518:1388-1654(+)